MNGTYYGLRFPIPDEDRNKLTTKIELKQAMKDAICDGLQRVVARIDSNSDLMAFEEEAATDLLKAFNEIMR